VFSDDNRAIYRPPGGLPEGLVTARLGKSWRNTTPIFGAVMQLSKGEEVEPRGPDGPPIEMLAVKLEDTARELSRVLHRLVVEGDVPARDVAVLTPHAVDHSTVKGRIGASTVTADPKGPRDVKLASIYRFKGLDAKAVVAFEVDRYVSDDFTRLM